MKLHITTPAKTKIVDAIQVTGSKSETNRVLLLQALYPTLHIENKSNSDDAQVMEKGLKVSQGTVDIHHAGTAMRFLTSYFASQAGKSVVLTGSARMQQRPIKVLVEALNSLGAQISYMGQAGYPPLKIEGKQLLAETVSLPANISSQYISSLCLVGASLPNGLQIDLVGKITSVPYIKMTLALLEEVGVQTSFVGNTIKIAPKKEVAQQTMVVESDWSSASYFYSLVALADVGAAITLSAYKQNSLQGDSVLAKIYTALGVTTSFTNNSIILTKVADLRPASLDLDLANAPDIAQTIAVSCLGLGIGCHLTGLHTLPIKETDRLAAMKTELEKFGASVTIDTESLSMAPCPRVAADVAVDTYNDHRMAMAFAPLGLKTNFYVNDADVVSKSYPDFWEDFKKVGFQIAVV